MSAADIPRDELATAMSVRNELGKEYEAEVIDAFIERIEKTVDARVEARLAKGPKGRRRVYDRTVTLALGSIALGIPVTGAASTIKGAGGIVAAVAAWGAIATINVVHAVRPNEPSS